MSLKLLQLEEAKQVFCSHAALSGNVLINNRGPDRCCQLHGGATVSHRPAAVQTAVSHGRMVPLTERMSARSPSPKGRAGMLSAGPSRGQAV